jgi:hypothetical protein
MVVPRTADTRVGMVVPYGLEAREGIGEHSDPFVFHKCGESRVYGDDVRPRDSAGLLRPNCVYIDF